MPLPVTFTVTPSAVMRALGPAVACRPWAKSPLVVVTEPPVRLMTALLARTALALVPVDVTLTPVAVIVVPASLARRALSRLVMLLLPSVAVAPVAARTPKKPAEMLPLWKLSAALLDASRPMPPAFTVTPFALIWVFAPVAKAPMPFAPDAVSEPPVKRIRPELSAVSAELPAPMTVTAVLLVAVTVEATLVVLIPVACKPLTLLLRAVTDTPSNVRLAPPRATPASPAAMPVSMLPPVMLIALRPSAVAPNKPSENNALMPAPVVRMELVPVIVTWPPLRLPGSASTPCAGVVPFKPPDVLTVTLLAAMIPFWASNPLVPLPVVVTDTVSRSTLATDAGALARPVRETTAPAPVAEAVPETTIELFDRTTQLGAATVPTEDRPAADDPLVVIVRPPATIRADP